MSHRNVNIDGSPLADGVTCTLDHSEQTFTITVRSLRFISPETIKNLIQTKFEVVDVKETESVSYVKPV